MCPFSFLFDSYSLLIGYLATDQNDTIINKMFGNVTRLTMCTLFDLEVLLTGTYYKKQSIKHTIRKEGLQRLFFFFFNSALFKRV